MHGLAEDIWCAQLVVKLFKAQHRAAQYANMRVFIRSNILIFGKAPVKGLLGREYLDLTVF
eukprot:scaffold116699_cov13-Tisochrysis_lutea.AAC.1